MWRASDEGDVALADLTRYRDQINRELFAWETECHVKATSFAKKQTRRLRLLREQVTDRINLMKLSTELL